MNFCKSAEIKVLIEIDFATVFFSANEESQKSVQNGSLLRSVNSRDAVSATPFIAAASLGILSSSALASMSTSTGTDATGELYFLVVQI